MGAGRAERGRRHAGDAPTCGQLLRRYRSAAGLTQEELAERAGYSANYIGKLERDLRELPAAAADRLADVLGLADEDRSELRAARERRGDRQEPPAVLLAGRDAEMGQIRRLLAGAGPPVLLLAGEPGIGKTRLLEEAAGLAAVSGWGIARGGCLRRAQDAYAPLSGALADALARLPAGERDRAVRQAGRVDLLLPEFSPPGDPGPGAASEEARPELQRRRLASSAGVLLRVVAGPAGTLLVLDDLHWAGPDAVDVLAALLDGAGSPPLRVIGAYRDFEAAPGTRLAEFVADLARASLVRVLPLGPLTDAEAGQLLAGLASAGNQQPGIVPAIVRRAGGVPFFLVSYAEQVRDGGPGASQLAVPWTVAQVIGQRVAGLPGPARELVSVAAVAGRVVPHALLAEVTGRGEEEVLAAVEAALAARLLAEDGPDRYRFGHDLIRETIEDGLSAARRRLLHRRIGQALACQPDAAAESLAFHYTRAGQDGIAADYLELAGDQAQQRVAYASAAEFYAAAATRLEAADRGTEVVPITEKHGVALYLAGRYDAAITALEYALEGYQAAGDAEAAARVTGRLAHAHYRTGTSGDALGQLGGLADAGAAPMPGAVSPGALAQWEGRVLLLYAQGAYKEIVTAARALARAGRAAGNQQMEATAARVEGVGLISLGQLAEGTTLMAAALSAEPTPVRAVDTTALLSAAYLAIGSPGRCQAVSEPMLAVAEHAGDQVAAAMHTAMLAGACYLRGDWRRGSDLAGQARQRFATNSPPMAVRAVGILASALTWHGDWDQARDYLDGCLRSARSLQIVHSERSALTYLAELDTLHGRPRDALIRLHPVTADHSPPATEELTWNYAVQLLSVLATAHLELGDLPPARAYARRAVSQARTTGAWMQGIRALEVHGMIQARDGRYDLARAAYQEGLHRAAAMPFPYGQARLLHAHGLLDRQQHDNAAAHAKLAQALAILDNLGAGKDAARLRQAIADTP